MSGSRSAAPARPTDPADRASALRAAVDAAVPDAVALRRRLHQAPLIGGAEAPTGDLVATAMGFPDAPRVAEGRLIRVGPVDGSAIALRAELDALPITEQTGVDWAATNEAMHACGHDVHLAALYAVVRAVSTVGGPAPLVAILQPREESYPCGAPDVVASPTFAANDVAAVVGVHVQPRLPAGTVAATPGPVNASSDELTITVHGRGGHGGYPQDVRDPVVASAAVVLALQQIVARRADPTHATVLSLGSVHAGEAANVIPDEAVLRGTLRTFDETERLDLIAGVRQIVDGTAAAYRCTATVRIDHGEPVLRNEPALTRAIQAALIESGVDASGELYSCGADDFAYYGAVAPATMIFHGVGATGPDAPNAPSLHSPRFLPPDTTVGEIARVMLTSYLAAAAATGSDQSSAAEERRHR